MAKIKINTLNKLSSIKPMHGGGQPPIISNACDTYFHYLTEAGIPYSRLHDAGGAFGGGKYVDIQNIFRDFDADVDNPESYDFTFTDHLINQLIKAGVEPYYRLGVTIENAAAVKKYWIAPPKDFEKWAQICEHIVRHYTKGWANGYYHKITYWEIWGEPDDYPYDNPQLWTGTPEDYYKLYEITAKHLKAHHPEIKVGGYGAIGFYNVWRTNAHLSEHNQRLEDYRVNFFRGFMNHVKNSGAPIDFFSWHNYANVKNIIGTDNWVHQELQKFGYDSIESHMNEWDPYWDEFGTGHHSAEIAAVMIAMQNAHASVCCIYDMRTTEAPYCPLFNPITHKPIQGYYAMVAFNTLYQLGTQIETTCDTEDLYVLAAGDGTRGAMLISNLTGYAQSIEIEGADLSSARYHVIDNERLLSWSPAVSSIEKNEVILIEW